MTKKPTNADLQAQLAASEAKNAANVDALMTEQSRLGTVIKALERTLADERQAHNGTRDVLHSTELELARTRGYLDASIDAKPPVMVPQQREGHLASYHDGTHSQMQSIMNRGFGDKPTPWWHR